MTLPEILAELYESEADMRTVLAEAGVPASLVAFDDVALNRWQSAVGVALNRGMLTTLVDIAIRQFPAREAALRLALSRLMFFACTQ